MLRVLQGPGAEHGRLTGVFCVARSQDGVQRAGTGAQAFREGGCALQPPGRVPREALPPARLRGQSLPPAASSGAQKGWKRRS